MTVATATELWQMGASELAALIRSRQASSEEVVEAHLRRIDAVNAAVNVLGFPAAAVPVGPAEAVQVIGPRYREDLCMDAAAAIEDRLGILTPSIPGE